MGAVLKTAKTKMSFSRLLPLRKYSTSLTNDVVIVGCARTPMGGFRGSLASFSAPQLGAVAISAALERPKDAVDEVYMARGDTPYGGVPLKDGLVADGLTDVYNKFHMGNCGENTAKKFNISRDEQDAYAVSSYQRAAKAYENGDLQSELVTVEVKGKRGKPSTFISEDEEFKKVNFDKFSKLATVFQRDGGTITAGNASTLNDGAAATVLMTAEAANSLGCKPLARIVGYAD